MWPAYFDGLKTRREGRRVSKSAAVNAPRILEMKDAADRLHLNAELIADVAYPKIPRLKTGMLLVEKRQSKDKTIREIAMQLQKIRSATAAK
jgi:signal recognition particle subunit SRP19